MDNCRLPTRVIRLKSGPPWLDDYGIAEDMTPGERMELTWELTLLAYSHSGEGPVTGRLRRDVVRIVRTGE